MSNDDGRYRIDPSILLVVLLKCDHECEQEEEWPSPTLRGEAEKNLDKPWREIRRSTPTGRGKTDLQSLLIEIIAKATAGCLVACRRHTGQMGLWR
jgi:hypothetical protein